MAPTVGTLTVRRQFLHTAQGRKASGRFVLLQGRRGDGGPAGMAGAAVADPDGGMMRFGLTASRKVGNAVMRNRARRRLRHALVALLPLKGRPGWDYVAVARPATVAAPWGELLTELDSLFDRLHAPPAHRGKDALKREAPSPEGAPPASTGATVPGHPRPQTSEDP